MLMPHPILLIENNATDAQVIEQLMQVKESVLQPDFLVTRVETLRHGMDRLAEGDFDAVLCNLDLPDAEGIEGFLRILVSAGMAVIILTDDLERAAPLVDLGVTDVIYKGSLENKLLRRSLLYSIASAKYAAIARASRLEHFLPPIHADDSAERNRVLVVAEGESQISAQVADLGFEVATATGAEANEVAARARFALILIEAQASNADALTLSTAIRKNKSLATVPIMVASRNFSTEEILKSQAAGVTTFISRPIRMGELALHLGNMSRLRSRETQLLELTERWQSARAALANYFPADFVENLLKQKFATEIDGARLRANVLMFALGKSEELCTALEPNVLSRLLNRLFGEIQSVIATEGGSVLDLNGDGLLATFGCPRPQADDLRHAARAALKIRDIVAALNATGSAPDGRQVRYGLALTTGDVFAGIVGSDHRREYVVLGEPVRRAAGLLELARRSSANLLIDAPSREGLGDTARVRRVRTKKDNAPEMYLLETL